jgi:hypothetical protein
MIASSVVAGTVPPGHGASGVVEYQLPPPVAVIVAAGLEIHPIKIKPRNMAHRLKSFNLFNQSTVPMPGFPICALGMCRSALRSGWGATIASMIKD